MNFFPGYFSVFILLLLIVLKTDLVVAQNYCTQTLKQAQSAYDEGRISEVPSIIEPCLKEGFNKEEKIEGYRLLTLTYLYLDEPAKADNSLLMLLRLKPEYKINPSVDPSELINLYNSFRTAPVYSIGLKGGTNYLMVNLIKSNSTSGNYNDKIKIKSNVGFQIGVAVEVPLQSRLELCPEILFSTKELKFDYVVTEQKSNYKERLNQLSLPVLIKYSLGTKKYIPTMDAGVEVNYLISAIGSTAGHNISPSTEVTSQRSSIGYGLVIGTGLKSKVGPGIISAGIKFYYALNTHIDKKETYSDNASFGMSYGMVNSLYKLNTFNFNVSYLIPIYKPKKIK